MPMKVSFVSVTQQVQHDTSMGRLTLNVLLSFAQFEREVTGERIRDKIAASKKKGMWMGGNRSARLRSARPQTPREPEGSGDRSHHLLELPPPGLRDGPQGLSRSEAGYPEQSKRSNSGIGTKTGGTSFSRGALYLILRSRIYVGEIAHKGGVYPGKHEAIIDRVQWNKVQKLLIA
jgi:site-specific DNA recombinase